MMPRADPSVRVARDSSGAVLICSGAGQPLAVTSFECVHSSSGLMQMRAHDFLCSMH